jgi:hypothetical protein
VFLSQLEHSATQLNQQYAAVLKTLEGQMESAFRDIHAEESQQLDALRSEVALLLLQDPIRRPHSYFPMLLSLTHRF